MVQDEKYTGINVSRRKALGSLLVILAMQSVASPAWAELTRSASVATAENLNDFISLSVFLTGVDQLDRDIARKILDYLLAEPWGAENFEQINAKLSVFIADESSDIPRWRVLHSSRFAEGERWFIRHILTTWFTGIYYYGENVQFITYRHALMNKGLLDIMPASGYSDEPFGFWSMPPEGKSV